jgi:predicted small secreted protein
MKHLVRHLWVACWLLGFLSACATAQGTGDVEHGFDIQNAGEANISNVVLSYGNRSIKFCRRYCVPKAGSFYGVYMPIQEELQVAWQTADGQTHEARVPVRAKVKDLSRLANLLLQFNGAELTVMQVLHYANPTILEFEKLPLYP